MTVAEMTCPNCKLRVFWSNESERYEHHYGNMDKNPMPCPAQDPITELAIRRTRNLFGGKT